MCMQREDPNYKEAKKFALYAIYRVPSLLSVAD